MCLHYNYMINTTEWASSAHRDRKYGGQRRTVDFLSSLKLDQKQIIVGCTDNGTDDNNTATDDVCDDAQSVIHPSTQLAEG